MRRKTVILAVAGLLVALVVAGAGAAGIARRPPELPAKAEGPGVESVRLTLESRPRLRQAAGQEQEGEEVPGGVIERFHDPSACDLVDVSTLPGNWTHGHYVSAVSELGDPALVPEAAHSDCGKPMVSLRRGPPPHALEKMKAKGEGPPGRANREG